MALPGEKRNATTDGFDWETWSNARPSRRWERYNVKLQEVWENVGWIHQTQNRNRVLVNTITNIGVQQNTGYFLTSWEPVPFSLRTLFNGFSYFVAWLVYLSKCTTCGPQGGTTGPQRTHRQSYGVSWRNKNSSVLPGRFLLARGHYVELHRWLGLLGSARSCETDLGDRSWLRCRYQQCVCKNSLFRFQFITSKGLVYITNGSSERSLIQVFGILAASMWRSSYFVKAELSPCLTTRSRSRMWEWGYSSQYSKPEQRWRWVAIVTCRPFYPCGNSSLCSLYTTLGGF